MHCISKKKENKSIKINKICNGIRQYFVFPEHVLKAFESNVDEIVKRAQIGLYKEHTVDYSPLRNKYFFGERYTYGTVENGLGYERLYPKNTVDPIPQWITHFIINPLIEAKIIPQNFVNSVVINDYQPRGCIVSHIDPPQIFDRPIVSLSLFSDSALCFGCKFQFKPIRCSKPLFKLDMPRGVVTSLSGFAANEITHCVRPEDVPNRRAVIMLRRVHLCAPRLQVEFINATKVSYEKPLVLNTVAFSKLRDSLHKWEKDGIHDGKVTKRINKKKHSQRYTEAYYTIL